MKHLLGSMTVPSKRRCQPSNPLANQGVNQRFDQHFEQALLRFTAAWGDTITLTTPSQSTSRTRKLPGDFMKKARLIPKQT